MYLSLDYERHLFCTQRACHQALTASQAAHLKRWEAPIKASDYIAE